MYVCLQFLFNNIHSRNVNGPNVMVGSKPSNHERGL